MDKIVDDIIKRYNLSPPINTIHLAEVLGYTIEWFGRYKDQYNDILGFADVGDNLIYVNNHVSTEDKLYTVAHELGQILLHPDLVKSKDYKVLTKDNRNEEAYALAYCFTDAYRICKAVCRSSL